MISDSVFLFENTWSFILSMLYSPPLIFPWVTSFWLLPTLYCRVWPSSEVSQSARFHCVQNRMSVCVVHPFLRWIIKKKTKVSPNLAHLREIHEMTSNNSSKKLAIFTAHQLDFLRLQLNPKRNKPWLLGKAELAFSTLNLSVIRQNSARDITIRID